MLVRHFLYHYNANTVRFFQPKSKKPLMVKGETYWVAEKYRIVDDLIQYYLDFQYQKETPKWIEASKMREGFSRYHVEVLDVVDAKLQSIDKKTALLFGVAPAHLICRFDAEKPKEFKKAEELWRLKQYWECLYDSTWDDNPEIHVFEFKLKKVNPKYPNYLDKHWVEKLK